MGGVRRVEATLSHLDRTGIHVFLLQVQASTSNRNSSLIHAWREEQETHYCACVAVHGNIHLSLDPKKIAGSGYS